MQSEISSSLLYPTHVHRFPSEAINCFTGSLAKLLGLHGVQVKESRLLEQGDGYLFRSGLDEWGYPEYTFAVQEVGLRGCARIGADMMVVAIDGEDWLDQLTCLANVHHGAVVWVNTSRLTHDTFYSENPAYLHALLVTGVSKDGQYVQIHDPLVVNRERYGCQAWVETDLFHVALKDQVRTETYNHMGFAHSVRNAPLSRLVSTEEETVHALARQATRYFQEELCRDAVSHYAAAFTAFFAQNDARNHIAARRLFDHINVLYVIPSLILLGQSLRTAGMSQEVLAHYGSLVDHWRALALLALKFEATASQSVLGRISDRFRTIASTERAMWCAIHMESQGKLPRAGLDHMSLTVGVSQ
jgi:hypothetical protein